MILFLPPAPKIGAFFDTIRASLNVETQAATYPGYGDVPLVGAASIEVYAENLLPQPADTTLVGFHTGCLVALEMALQSKETCKLILVDIPLFDAATKRKHGAGLDDDNPAHDAFRAAFAYDLETTLEQTSASVICVATKSSLYDPTIKASAYLTKNTLIKRQDICAPAFEGPAMAELICQLTS